MTGSAKLTDKAWQAIKAFAVGQKAQDAHVKVGVVGPTAGVAAEGAMTMVELAAIHEFGAPDAGIPERSFIRSTFAKKQGDVDKVAARLAKKFLAGEMPLERALGLLGAWGAAEVKKSITVGEGIQPANAPATIARKGSSRPLVDTGRLVGAISWEVVDAGNVELPKAGA